MKGKLESMEDNQQIIERVKKLFAVGEGESHSGSDKIEINNEAFVAIKLARKLIAKHQLDESIIRRNAEETHQVYVAPQYGKSIIDNPHRRANARGLNKRRIWFEKLAEVVSEGNFCKIGLIPQNGQVSFYGFDMDREIAIFTFLKLAEIADRLCKIEMKKCEATVGAVNFKTKEVNPPIWCGDDSFIESFHQGFRELIKETYDELISEENGNATSNIGVEKFCKNDYDWQYRENPEIVRRNDALDMDEIPIEEFYVKVGRKIGERASKKLSLDEGKGKVAGLIQVEFKKSKAKFDKERKLLEDKLGIDPNLPEEIIFALDDSGSMSGSKIDLVKNSATSGAQNLTNVGKKVGLVTFGSDEDRIINPSNPLGEDFYQVISKLTGRNSTPMHDAIRKATDYFKTINARRTLIIVTDGQPNSEEKALEEAQKAKDIGTNIQVIGTDDAPKDFMDKLSSDGKSTQVGNAQLGTGIANMVKMLSA